MDGIRSWSSDEREFPATALSLAHFVSRPPETRAPRLSCQNRMLPLAVEFASARDERRDRTFDKSTGLPSRCPPRHDSPRTLLVP